MTLGGFKAGLRVDFVGLANVENGPEQKNHQLRGCFRAPFVVTAVVQLGQALNVFVRLAAANARQAAPCLGFGFCGCGHGFRR
ncbi:MAG: hypothetical protein CL844_04905 [Crocinitomicaceae bacterium]|nr:hypothetical protein [Crocinitomicaceae bacterium]